MARLFILVDKRGSAPVEVTDIRQMKKIFDEKMNIFDMNNDPFYTELRINEKEVDLSKYYGQEWVHAHYVEAYAPIDDVWYNIGKCNFIE